MALIRPPTATISIAEGETAGTISGDMTLHAVQPGMEIVPGSRFRRASQGGVIKTWALTSDPVGASFTLDEPFKDFSGADAGYAAQPFVIETGGSAAALAFSRIGATLLAVLGLETTLAGESKTINLDRVDSDATFGQILFSRAGRLWGDLIQRKDGVERFQLRVYPDGSSPVTALDIDGTDGTSDRRVKASDVAIVAGLADIGAARTEIVRLTGSGPVTSFGAAPHRFRIVSPAAPLTIQHNATSLVLPDGADMPLSEGQALFVVSDGSGNWRALAASGGGSVSRQVYHGEGAPGAGLGSDGDFYIDTDAYAIYGPKSGDWGAPASLVGAPGEGSGDVVGPASATSGRIALFDGATGKLLKEGTAPLSDLPVAASGTSDATKLVRSDDSRLSGNERTANKGTPGGYASLDGGGRVPVAQIPAVAITDVFIVGSQAAMLALTAERGDVAIRTDIAKSLVLATDSPGTLADWKELLTPPNSVISVAGLTGTISSAALTAALGAFVASGGSHAKGLVPDPGATAGTTKYLREDATWAEPSASVDATTRRNLRLASMRVSKALGSAQRFVNSLADGFSALDGLNTGASSNYALDGGAKCFSPTITQTIVGPASTTTGTALGSSYVALDMSFALPNNVTVASLGLKSAAAGTGSIGIYRRNSAGSFTLVAGVAAISHAGGGAYQDYALASPYTVPATGSYYVGAWNATASTWSGSSASVARALLATGTNPAVGDTLTLTEATGPTLVLRATHSVVVNNMTLVGVTSSADAVPTTIQALLDVEPVDSITLGTDLTVEVSRDGGTTWTAASLTQVASLGARSLYESASTSVTGQPSGSSVAYRLKTLNNKMIRLHGLNLAWT